MAVQMVTYILRKTGRNYDSLHAEIRKLGFWWQCVEAVWLIDTELSCEEIRERLREHIEPTDDLVVLGLNGNWATLGLSDQCNNWLRSNLNPEQPAKE